jgi:hypothetical protein
MSINGFDDKATRHISCITYPFASQFSAMWGGVNLVAIVVALVAVVYVDGAGFSTHNLAVTLIQFRLHALAIMLSVYVL